MPSPPPLPLLVRGLLHGSPRQSQTQQVDVSLTHSVSSSETASSSSSLLAPRIGSLGLEYGHPPPGSSSSVHSAGEGQHQAAAVPTQGSLVLSKAATASGLLSTTPPILNRHGPLPGKGDPAPGEGQRRSLTSANRRDWSTVSASTASGSTTSLTVNSNHEDMQLDPPSPGLGIVAAFMAGASASASASSGQPLPRPQTAQQLFRPTQTLEQAPMQPHDAADGLPSSHNSSKNVSPGSNVERSASLTPFGFHRWSRKEDLLLLAAVKQHGEEWNVVVAEISKGGGPLRTPRAAESRYERLRRNASKAAPVPLPAPYGRSAARSVVRTSSQYPPERQQPNLSSRPTASATPSSSLTRAWSIEEDEALIALRQSCKMVKDMWPAFAKRFPGTKRTASALQTRWHDLLRLKQVVGDEQRNSMAAREPASASPAQCSRLATASPQPTLPSRAATTPFLSASEGSSAGSRAPSPSATTAATPQPSSPALKYSIEYLPQGGFFIRHLPPLHEVHILSPTLCEVVKPDATSLVPHIKAEHQEEERLTMAPFVFRVSAEGFIQPLALPPGTETCISFIDGEGQEELEGGNEQTSSMVETQFTALDNYVVVFRNRVSD